ncbi:MAG: ATP-binding cassette domain-containing protein [Proteobacteria bacterium]|nr:ATP-binding cassette domain-containing protein [Pseudomonadota bacterium]
MALAVRVRDLWKSFRSGWFWRSRNEVLRGINLDIEEGRIFGILGPNGAGKTTFLSILSTLLLPDRGQVEVLGMDVVKGGNRVRQRVNISSGNANFLWSLTVRENLTFYAMLYGLGGTNRKKKVIEAIELFELGNYEETSFDRLSTGMKQRLALAKSMLNNPEILFLDEPTVGLDPDVSLKIRDQIREIQRERAITIVLTTHNMAEAEYLCDRIAFLKGGEIYTVGTAQELKRSVRMGDVITIAYEGGLHSIQLEKLPGIIDFSMSDGRCQFVVDSAARSVSGILQGLWEAGIVVKEVKTSQTNLEEVFLEFAK